MKRLLIIALLTATIYSCSKIIPYTPEQKDPVLIVNALMNTRDTIHAVNLGISHVNRVEKIPDNTATVSLFVNGDLKLTEDVTYSICYLKYIFKIGDKVKLSVKYGDKTAYSEVEVLPVAEITRVDSIASTANGKETVKFIVRINDRKNENNCYMIGAENEFYTIDDLGRPIAADLSYTPVELINSDETLLNGGHNDATDYFEDFEYHNYSNIFNDVDIKNGSYGLKVHISKYDMNSYEYSARHHYTSQYDPKLTYYIHKSLIFSLYSISEIEFKYRKAVNILESNYYDMSFMEPVAIPGNITGGIGIFGIASSADYVIELPVKAINPNPQYTNYNQTGN